ncbi:MAG: AmmeMemoRadiSam system protein B [Calditrichaeota bacterium]|nr:AmmeMemoRadiSam system protein B [Calditrichota bacterium]
MSNENKIREPAVAGMFYSGNPQTLEREVALFLENSMQEKNVQHIYGLVSPHAGYMYSGGVAARAYRQVLDYDYDVVVVISPSHHVYFEKVSVYNGDYYATPLGIIPVDKELCQLLADADPQLIYSSIGHDGQEHALEVQLPFLQHVLDEFKLIPIVMGNQDMNNILALAESLGKVLKDQKTLIVASSDLSHYHSYEEAVRMDSVVISHINNFKEENLYDDLSSGLCEMCGGGPVIAMMKACRYLGADKAKVILYRNSGDVTDDRSQVVGYLAAMIYK